MGRPKTGVTALGRRRTERRPRHYRTEDRALRITKAVITAAGRGARQHPAFDTVQKAMLPLVDRDGLAKPVLQVIAEEALASGIEQICVVAAPGDEESYRRQFHALASNL